MMKRIKRILLIVAAVSLVLPSFLATASTTTSKQEKTSSHNDGKISSGEVSSKDEVVYATLSPTGDQQEIYVVNALEVEKPGEIVDYGSYVSLKNLSDLTELQQSGDHVQFMAEEGKFFYQGNMNGVALPWDVTISYFLNDKKISPEELAGKDGHVQIKIETFANEKANSIFAENYLLQISVPLAADVFRHIRAEDGMIANVGKNKQVTFTVMPENEGEFLLEADVVDFALDGIDLTGMPSSVTIDAPDVDEMTDDMQTLSDAIAELNDGVAKLKGGVSELNNGVADFQAGSLQYKNGIAALDGSSAKLVNSSEKIGKALGLMSSSLGDIEGMDVSEMDQLVTGLMAISRGLSETADGLATLKENYSGAYRVFDGAMGAIPSSVITEEEIQALYGSGANPEVVGKLVDTYIAAQTAKGTYSHVKPAFDAVGVTLDAASAALKEMATNVQTMAKGLAAAFKSLEDIGQLGELFDGIITLSSNYQAFHSGLVSYTDGVGQLATAYSAIHDGVVGLSGGTAELDNGVGQLHNGTAELHESTSDLPEQMQAEIDQMISDYDKSDFEAVSFVSEKNERVGSVQFVMKTESIKAEKTETTEAPKKEKKGFWARLLDLFK